MHTAFVLECLQFGLGGLKPGCTLSPGRLVHLFCRSRSALAACGFDLVVLQHLEVNLINVLSCNCCDDWVPRGVFGIPSACSPPTFLTTTLSAGGPNRRFESLGCFSDVLFLVRVYL